MNTLGEALKNERTRQGLEIKDIEEAISIRAIYLSAIEEGNHSIVPGEVYLKGFIRNYATHLGLDPQLMLELYRQDKETLPLEERAFEDEGVSAKTKDSSSKIRKYQRRREERREEKKKRTFSFLKWAVVLVLAAGAIAWGAMSFPGFTKQAPQGDSSAQLGNNFSEEKPQLNTNTQTTLPPAASPPPSPPAGQTAQPPPTAPVEGKSVTVAAKFNGRCWTQVNVDGKLAYEGTPKTGESLTFSAEQKIFIKFGNAGVVEVTHNGKTLGTVGKPGEVIIKTFTKDGEISVSSS